MQKSRTRLLKILIVSTLLITGCGKKGVPTIGGKVNKEDVPNIITEFRLLSSQLLTGHHIEK